MKLDFIESKIKYLLSEAGEESVDTLVKMALTETRLSTSDIGRVLSTIRSLAKRGLIKIVLSDKTGACFLRSLDNKEIESLTNLFKSYKINPDGSWTIRHDLEIDFKTVYVIDSGLVETD